VLLTDIKKTIKTIIENQGGAADFNFIVDEILKNFQIIKKDGTLFGENSCSKVVKTILGDISSGKMFTLDRQGNWTLSAPAPVKKNIHSKKKSHLQDLVL